MKTNKYNFSVAEIVVYKTTDYDLFDMHEWNRDLRENQPLAKSLQDHGFNGNFHIVTRRIPGSQKLKIIFGHHRFYLAKRLGLEIYFTIDETGIDMAEFERTSRVWTIEDYLVAGAKSGNAHYQRVIDFKRKHGMTTGASIALVGGESAGSGNKKVAVKAGTFTAGTDSGHAETVAKIVDGCSRAGIKFATSSAFVSAVSMAIRVPEFEPDVFIRRIERNPGAFTKRGTKLEYLDEIESAYNYGAHNKRLAVSFLATEEARKRQENFGR